MLTIVSATAYPVKHGFFCDYINNIKYVCVSARERRTLLGTQIYTRRPKCPRLLYAKTRSAVPLSDFGTYTYFIVVMPFVPNTPLVHKNRARVVVTSSVHIDVALRSRIRVCRTHTTSAVLTGGGGGRGPWGLNSLLPFISDTTMSMFVFLHFFFLQIICTNEIPKDILLLRILLIIYCKN